MINWKDVKGSGDGLISRSYPGISLGRLRKTIKTCQNSRCRCQDSNLVSSKYKLKVLPLEPTCSVSPIKDIRNIMLAVQSSPVQCSVV
jgi:hypothetical protein